MHPPVQPWIHAHIFGPCATRDVSVIHADIKAADGVDLVADILTDAGLATHESRFSGKRGRRVLHVAPEPCLETRLRARLGADYVTADLFNPAMLRMDTTAIDHPDDSFDVIYCSHVLEHVSDDKRAMRELARVLSPGGWAIFLVPIIAEHSHEDPTVTDPRERERLYGRNNHVRAYGPDYADRLRECGFEVTVTAPRDLASAADVVHFGLTPAAGFIHYRTKAPR